MFYQCNITFMNNAIENIVLEGNTWLYYIKYTDFTNFS